MQKDRYRYFRIEAQELIEGLGQGLLETERGPHPEAVRRLLRQAHTLKGAARVVRKAEIGDLAHALEDLLSPHRETGGPLSSDHVNQALALLEQIRKELSELDAPPRPSPSHPITDEGRGEKSLAIRVAIGDLDALLELALETHTEASSLRKAVALFSELQEQVLELLERVDHGGGGAQVQRLTELARRGARDIAEQTERVLAEVQELRVSTSELRMVPVETLMVDVQRAALEAARSLGIDVEIRCIGGHIHVDAHILTGVRGALIHTVRNSVAHGFVPGIVGHIEITVEQRGQRVCIRCRDDGRGLDLAAIRQAAVARGLATPEVMSTMDERGVIRLLMSGGLSTSRAVTDVSGRGVGLDAVRHAIEGLKGQVSVDHRPGEGVSVELVVPISLASVAALSLRVGSIAVLLPIDCVRRTLRVTARDWVHNPQGDQIAVEGRLIPFLALRKVLGQTSSPTPSMSAVIVVHEDRELVVGVDSIGGVANVVVRAVPDDAALDPVIAGATLDDDGSPQLVLSPPHLLQAAAQAWNGREDPVVDRLPPLLVIDDSLTTRMLEQSILESAGYEVDVATCGEEGLQKARRRRYGAFVVDVEMPGMSGFEFIEQTQRDADLRHIPAILVTSRSDPADKLRGKEVGARAYIVKSEFDQAELLQMIRRFVG